MIQDWLAAIPAMIVAALWLTIPGGLLLWSVGLRGFLLVAAAPAASVGTLACLAIAMPRVGVQWSPATVAIIVIVLGAAAFGIRAAVRARRRDRDPATPSERGAVAVSMRTVGLVWAAAAVAVVVQLVIVYQRPDAVSQTFDDGFHLNVVRFIMDTGNASSFWITSLIGTSGIYPAAWHDLVSLVAMTSGSAVPVAATAFNMVVAAGVWTSGAVLLGRSLFPGRIPAVIAAGLVSVLLPWFPLLPLTFGVLFPYFLALAMLPVAVILSASVLGRLGPALHGVSLGGRLVALGITLTAIALAQPAVVFAAGALALPAFVGFVADRIRSSPARPRRAMWVAIAIVVLCLFTALWVVVGRFGANAPWGPSAGWRGAALESVLQFRLGSPPSWFIGVVVVVGLVAVVWKRRQLWVAAGWLIAASLYVVAEAVSSPQIRLLVTGLFYKDPPRLASLLAVAALPVAVVGVVALWDAVAARAARGRGSLRPLRGVLATIGLVLLAVIGQAPAMTHAIAASRASYSSDSPAPILDDDEYALLLRLPQETDPDGVIAGNPWTGTNLAYAIADREVLNPHFNLSGDPDHVIINTRLVDAASDPEVCAAVERTRVRYVLDFGSYFRDAAGLLVFDATAGYEGLVGVGDAPGFQEIDREGAAVLYRITAC